MQKREDAEAEMPAGAHKDQWQKPEIVSVTPISDTRGGGAAGFDFGSEISAP